MSDAAPRNARRLPWLAWTFRFWSTVVGLTIAGFCLASGFMLYDMRRDTWNEAVTSEFNLLNALSQDIARNIELYDLSLRAVVDGLAEPGFADLTPRVQDRLLYDRAATASDLGAILILDTDGKVIRRSSPGLIGADLSDKEYFQALRSDPNRGLFISNPFRRRVTGDDDVIALARALRGSHGEFSGVVVGTLRLAYLRGLFEKPTIGPQGAINLFLLDGTCIMRVPYETASIGRSLAGTVNFNRFIAAPSGTFSGRSVVDGVQRIYSFTHVGDLPLILSVAYSEHDVLAPWRSKAIIIVVSLVALCGVAIVLTLLKARSEAEHRLLADNAIDVVIRLDGSLRRTYVSPSAFRVLGYQAAEMLGGEPKQITHPDDWPIVEAWIAEGRTGRSIGNAVFRVRRKDGAFLWVEGRCRAVPNDRGFLVVLRDISERKAAEERAAILTAELARLANSDGLTGLSNRRHFDQVLAAECARAAQGTDSLSLLLLDVDRFKTFNDRYGHQEGDACLRRVSDAVRNAVTCPDALVARYGGEELAVILPRTDAASAAAEAEQVRDAVERLGVPHIGNAGEVVTVSVGCATAGGVAPRAEPQVLVALTDARLYEAKRTGRNRVVAWDKLPPHAISTRDEDNRLAALARHEMAGTLDPSASFDHVCRLAGHLFGTSSAFMSLVKRDHVVLVGRHGVTERVAARTGAFCSYTIAGDEPLVVLDATLDPRFADSPIVRQGCRFYAGASLVDPVSGHRLGALCVIDEKPRSSFDRSHRDVLAGLADLLSKDLKRSLSAAERRGSPWSEVA